MPDLSFITALFGATYRKKSTLSMYLDDVRTPATLRNWIVIRNYTSAIEYVQSKGCPSFISFDYDLGKNSLSGYSFAIWLIEHDKIHHVIPDNFEFAVHSPNCIGDDHIRLLLANYLSKKNTK